MSRIVSDSLESLQHSTSRPAMLSGRPCFPSMRSPITSAKFFGRIVLMFSIPGVGMEGAVAGRGGLGRVGGGKVRAWGGGRLGRGGGGKSCFHLPAVSCGFVLYATCCMTWTACCMGRERAACVELLRVRAAWPPPCCLGRRAAATWRRGNAHAELFPAETLLLMPPLHGIKTAPARAFCIMRSTWTITLRHVAARGRVEPPRGGAGTRHVAPRGSCRTLSVHSRIPRPPGMQHALAATHACSTLPPHAARSPGHAARCIQNEAVRHSRQMETRLPPPPPPPHQRTPPHPPTLPLPTRPGPRNG